MSSSMLYSSCLSKMVIGYSGTVSYFYVIEYLFHSVVFWHVQHTSLEVAKVRNSLILHRGALTRL